MHSRKFGEHWERVAESFLHEHGLKTITRNYNCPFGEIDLIMQHGEYCVFTEIRYRKNINYGSGAETVTKTKQKRIIRTAQRYLQKHAHRAMLACRFDVISMSHKNGNLDIDWIQDAFTTGSE